MSNLEEIAKKEVLLNDSEIFSIDFENKKYWLKKARPTKPNKIQKFFYKFFPFELLIPSSAKNAFETLEYETQKLQKFKALGINTANIAYKCDDFFVLEDCGRTMHSLMRKNISEEAFYEYVDLILEELSKIHKNGLFHGGAQTRNFTYKDGAIFVIDLEESFDSSISVETLQFRDFLLFLLSFLKIKSNFQINYEYIINKYMSLTGNSKTKERLNKMANKISILIYLSEMRIFQNMLGSDVKSFFKLFKILKTL